MARRSASRRMGEPAPPFRIGCGADVHPLVRGRRLVLGGVRIPHSRGLHGHSDADVLAHAVCDAVLGALGLPDLGTRFRDTDERWRDRSSLVFLRDVGKETRARGYRIVNLDSVLMAEAPRLRSRLPAMRRSLARALGCPIEAIGVKAKRCEGVGAVGRQEGMMAQAVVLLTSDSSIAPVRQRGSGRGNRS